MYTLEYMFENYAKDVSLQETHRTLFIHLLLFSDNVDEEVAYDFLFTEDGEYRVNSTFYTKLDWELFLPALAGNLSVSSEFLSKLYIIFKKNYYKIPKYSFFATDFLLSVFDNPNTPEWILEDAMKTEGIKFSEMMIICFCARGFHPDWSQEWLEAHYGVKLYDFENSVLHRKEKWKILV